MSYYIKFPSERELKQFFLSGCIYNTSFEEKITPSATLCIELAIKNSRQFEEKMQVSSGRVVKKWERHFKQKSIATVTEKINSVLASGRKYIELKHLMQHPPASLSKKQARFFKDLLNCYLELMNAEILAKFALKPTPCFFEETDLICLEQELGNPDNYQINAKFREYKSRPLILRQIMDGRQRVQKIDTSITISQDEQMQLKYTVYNQQDKLDLVVNLSDGKYTPLHYHASFKTPRGNNPAKEFTLELTQSKGTKNFIIKTEDPEETTYTHNTEIEMLKNPFYEFISKNPVFLGGNAFLYLSQWVAGHRKEIIKTICSIKSVSNSNRLENRIRGLEKIIVTKQNFTKPQPSSNPAQFPRS